MTMETNTTENNVDHFLISTRENQLMVIFVDPKELVNIWED
jgi:hypothetical protein